RLDTGADPTGPAARGGHGTGGRPGGARPARHRAGHGRGRRDRRAGTRRHRRSPSAATVPGRGGGARAGPRVVDAPSRGDGAPPGYRRGSRRVARRHGPTVEAKVPMSVRYPWMLVVAALVVVGLALGYRALNRGRVIRRGWRRHVPPALFLAALAVLLVAVARPAATVQVPHVAG